jgi:hypothetical protein
MNTTILELVKDRLGIRTAARNSYINAIIDAVIEELGDEKGLTIDIGNNYHLLFVVDFVTWRYQSRDSEGSMPRHLQYRLHNLVIHTGGGADV